MKLNTYSYYDQKAKCFCTPMFTSDSIEVTKENVQRAVATGNIKFNARDFSLYYLGVFDDVAGVIYGIDKPELIAHLVEFIPQEVTGNE